MTRHAQALQCALGRFAVLPSSIVLVAHDKHSDRAFADLASLYPGGNITNPHLVSVPYEDAEFLSPVLWSARELCIARPLDALRRTFGTATYPGPVRLGRVEVPR